MKVTESLIQKIENQISNIYRSKGDLDFQLKVIEDKYTKLKFIFKEIHKVFKSVEKAYRQLD